MKFMKHIGKYKNADIVIVFREVPDELDQCLVAYPREITESLLHDEFMKCLESEVAQTSTDLSDVLFRSLMADGKNILLELHSKNFLHKVPTNEVVVTPTSKDSIPLDQLNQLLGRIKSGEKLVDESMGRDLGEPNIRSNEKVLTDNDLANDMLKQAAKMEAEAKRLLDESKRLATEAKSLLPATASKTKQVKENARAKKTTKKKTPA